MKSSGPPPDGWGLSGSRDQYVKVALAGRVKEFPVESGLRRWLRRINEIVELPVYGGEYALYLGRRRAYGVGAAVVAIALLFAFLPRSRVLLWPVLAWTLLLVSAIVVLGVACSILVAVVSMYTGYPARADSVEKLAAATAGKGGVVPLDGRSSEATTPVNPWADVLNNLRSAENALCELERSIAFEAFTDGQKHQYYQVCREVETLIHELSGETALWRKAS